ncbi:hypothetical protein MCHI_000267, partial [Candidatus Magnetoovum chiemensis]
KMLHFMSNTITNFRNFFKPEQRKSFLNVKEAAEDVINLLKSQLETYNILISRLTS